MESNQRRRVEALKLQKSLLSGLNLIRGEGPEDLQMKGCRLHQGRTLTTTAFAASPSLRLSRICILMDLFFCLPSVQDLKPHKRKTADLQVEAFWVLSPNLGSLVRKLQIQKYPTAGRSCCRNCTSACLYICAKQRVPVGS